MHLGLQLFKFILLQKKILKIEEIPVKNHPLSNPICNKPTN